MNACEGVAPPRYPTVHVDVPAGDSSPVASDLWELGAQGIEERDGTTLDPPSGGAATTLVAHFSDEAVAARVAQHLCGRYPARVELIHGDDWRDGWRRYFKPMRIGARLVVRPSWEPVALWPGEVRLTLDPGTAFGSGTHETTRLVLREVDRRVHRALSVLDVGCGSGILSVAALLLGASRARAVDVDPDAVEVARENARLNRVASRLRVSTSPVARLRGEYDLVVANIESRVLVPLAGEICRRVAPGGCLVLGGILREQWREVAAAYGHLTLSLMPAEGEWVALVMHRPPGAS